MTKLTATLLGIIAMLLVACGGLAWKLSVQTADAEQTHLQQLRQSTFSGKKYSYIDPLLACDLSTPKDSSEFLPLKNRIANLIGNKLSTHDADTVSVYMRWRGKWFGINDNDKFFPASLMKVPTMIAAYKVAEQDPSLLKKEVTYTGTGDDLNAGEYFKPAQSLTVGQTYTIDELVRRMIIYSDNNALALIVHSIDAKTLSDVYTDLGITIPPDEGKSLEDFITVKEYANIFRVLYNSSYLSRDMSEKALGLLVDAQFPVGLQAALPSNIPLANKFGERSFSTDPNDPTSEKELHDCGFAYTPSSPYLICVMTRGTNFDKLAGTIRDISKEVYTYVSANASTTLP